MTYTGRPESVKAKNTVVDGPCYGAVPVRALCDRDLWGLPLALLGIIAAHDRMGKGCWATQRRLAKLLGVRQASISDAERKLDKKGLVTVTPDKKDQRRRFLRVRYTAADRAAFNAVGGSDDDLGLQPTDTLDRIGTVDRISTDHGLIRSDIKVDTVSSVEKLADVTEKSFHFSELGENGRAGRESKRESIPQSSVKTPRAHAREDREEGEKFSDLGKGTCSHLDIDLPMAERLTVPSPYDLDPEKRAFRAELQAEAPGCDVDELARQYITWIDENELSAQTKDARKGFRGFLRERFRKLCAAGALPGNHLAAGVTRATVPPQRAAVARTGEDARLHEQLQRQCPDLHKAWLCKVTFVRCADRRLAVATGSRLHRTWITTHHELERELVTAACALWPDADVRAVDVQLALAAA